MSLDCKDIEKNLGDINLLNIEDHFRLAFPEIRAPRNNSFGILPLHLARS
jgi:hypothetical protein